jgi:CRP/FNR family cyclic AMP-dependent transcriptional regulator
MSDLIERILLLKSSPAFNHVKTEDLRIVAQSLEEETYFSGEHVFEIGEHGDCMYIIQTGKIGISLDTGTKNTSQFIAQLAEGDCFGEMNLLDDLPRSASAHVIEDATLLVLEKSRLRGLIISYPELSLGMLKSLSLRLREANLSK